MQCNCLKYNYLIFRTPLYSYIVDYVYTSVVHMSKLALFLDYDALHNLLQPELKWRQCLFFQNLRQLPYAL